jgi:hypothetical protein
MIRLLIELTIREGLLPEDYGDGLRRRFSLRLEQLVNATGPGEIARRVVKVKQQLIPFLLGEQG